MLLELRRTLPLTRPPSSRYGDIDDRVRYICQQLGLTPIIWTVAGDISYGEHSPPNSSLRRGVLTLCPPSTDTQDWQIQAGEVTAAKVLQNFETIINGSAALDTGASHAVPLNPRADPRFLPPGFIVLEHDLAEQCVDLSRASPALPTTHGR